MELKERPANRNHATRLPNGTKNRKERERQTRGMIRARSYQPGSVENRSVNEGSVLATTVKEGKRTKRKQVNQSACIANSTINFIKYRRNVLINIIVGTYIYVCIYDKEIYAVHTYIYRATEICSVLRCAGQCLDLRLPTTHWQCRKKEKKKKTKKSKRE